MHQRNIIAGAHCKKVILHTYEAKWWRDGMSIPYTGLNNMGLCDDAVELEYSNENRAEILSCILETAKD